MRFLPAAGAAAAVYLLVLGPTRIRLVDRIAVYLRRAAPTEAENTPAPTATELRLRHAGLDWTVAALRLRRAIAGVAGAFVGLLTAQGDLVVTAAPQSAPGLAVAGAGAGVLGLSMWMTRRIEQRRRRLRQEVPTVADALALRVLSGDSVGGALDGLVEAAQGVVIDELRDVVAAHREGTGLPEALTTAARLSTHADAGRLYAVLANAHRTGSRLAEGLTELAVDYRAALARDLTAEGGRRAIATYGPILALMIPVALLFLMYPTLAALRDLSTGP